MKKFAVGAAVALALGAASVLPASAGIQEPTMTVSADISYVGDSVVIANTPDDISACFGQVIPAAGDVVPVQVDFEVEDPDGDLIVDVNIIPDADGNWSIEVGPLETVGEYTAFADCEVVPNEVESIEPSEIAPFRYEPITFEVIAQAPTTTTTAAPATSTTSTTAAAVVAATATPRFAG